MIKGIPLPPFIPLAVLWAAVMGIKRTKFITEKVSFYLLTKKVYSHKG